MTNHGITVENLLLALPETLQEDAIISNLAAAISAQLEKLIRDISSERIYANIDCLDAPLLDILASDFKVDWWRPDAPLEEKRSDLKRNWYVHKHLGTKSAIETAVSDFIGSGDVEEWFEYGGQPYHFRIRSENNAEITSNYAAFMAVLNAVKRCTAVLDHITAVLSNSQTLYIGAAMRTGKKGSAVVAAVDTSPFSILADECESALVDESGNILLNGESV